MVAVSGTEEACAEALQKADELLSAKTAAAATKAAERSSRSPASRWRSPATRPTISPSISVPGDYAAAEAMKALRLGMDVMLFSDNVPPEPELALKTYAREHDLMVMGPDCGTAIVNGVPLGFANVVRRGPIGVVGASGTGTQEVTVRIHQLGSGISQALGTGGHDLADVHRRHLDAARARRPRRGPGHEQSSCWCRSRRRRKSRRPVLAAAEASAKPVVVIFLGADPASITRNGVHGAAYLAQAADMAVALAQGEASQQRSADHAVERNAAKAQ